MCAGVPVKHWDGGGELEALPSASHLQYVSVYQ